MTDTLPIATPTDEPERLDSYRRVDVRWPVGRADEDGWCYARLVVEYSPVGDKHQRGYHAVLSAIRIHGGVGIVPCEPGAFGARTTHIYSQPATWFGSATLDAVCARALTAVRRRYQWGDGAIAQYFTPNSEVFTPAKATPATVGDTGQAEQQGRQFTAATVADLNPGDIVVWPAGTALQTVTSAEHITVPAGAELHGIKHKRDVDAHLIRFDDDSATIQFAATPITVATVPATVKRLDPVGRRWVEAGTVTVPAWRAQSADEITTWRSTVLAPAVCQFLTATNSATAHYLVSTSRSRATYTTLWMADHGTSTRLAHVAHDTKGTQLATFLEGAPCELCRPAVVAPDDEEPIDLGPACVRAFEHADSTAKAAGGYVVGVDVPDTGDLTHMEQRACDEAARAPVWVAKCVKTNAAGR